MDFIPVQGRVAINKIPKRIELMLKERPELLVWLKRQEKSSAKYWSFPPGESNPKDFSSFPDPEEHLIGFYSC